MKLHHMARKGDDEDKSDSAVMDADKYPHGLHIHLGHEELAKLGLKDKITAGDKLHIEAHAHVTDSHEPADGKKDGRSVGLHITHMGAEPKGDLGKHKSLRDELKGNVDAEERGKGQPRKGREIRKAERGKDAATETRGAVTS